MQRRIGLGAVLVLATAAFAGGPGYELVELCVADLQELEDRYNARASALVAAAEAKLAQLDDRGASNERLQLEAIKFVNRQASSASRTRINAPNDSRLCTVNSQRESRATWRCSSSAVAFSVDSLHVIKMLAPGECSAWASKSAAVKSGRVVSSAITTTSLGPAIESMSTSP